MDSGVSFYDMVQTAVMIDGRLDKSQLISSLSDLSARKLMSFLQEVRNFAGNVELAVEYHLGGIIGTIGDRDLHCGGLPYPAGPKQALVRARDFTAAQRHFGLPLETKFI